MDGKFIFYEHMNKKQRAVLDRQRRTVWNVKPVTKVVPSKKIYNRKRLRDY